jgi:hypothetical protein
MPIWFFGPRRGVYRTMFLAAWSSGGRKRSTPLDDRQIVPMILLSASRDLAGAKRVAENAAARPLKWEAGGALRSVNAVVRAQGPHDGQYGWYLITRSQ